MNEKIDTTIRNIAHRWDGTDRSILGYVIPRLVDGSPFPVGELARLTGSGPEEIERQLEMSGADRNDAGDITGLGGISIDEGVFFLEGSGISTRTCCALTAHAVPIISGRAVEIRSVDPVDQTPLRLSVSPHGVVSADPRSVVATMVTLDTPQQRVGLFSRFCQFARYFRSSQTSASFPFGERETLSLSPFEVHEAAKLWVRFVWGIESSGARGSTSPRARPR